MRLGSDNLSELDDVGMFQIPGAESTRQLETWGDQLEDLDFSDCCDGESFLFIVHLDFLQRHHALRAFSLPRQPNLNKIK